MAYFDSPKNRALWEKELAGLRKEKERRAKGGSLEEDIKGENNIDMPVTERSQQRNMENSSYREKTSYQELLKEEMEMINSKKKTKDMTLKVEKTKQKEIAAPSL